MANHLSMQSLQYWTTCRCVKMNLQSYKDWENIRRIIDIQYFKLSISFLPNFQSCGLSINYISFLQTREKLGEKLFLLTEIHVQPSVLYRWHGVYIFILVLCIFCTSCLKIYMYSNEMYFSVWRIVSFYNFLVTKLLQFNGLWFNGTKERCLPLYLSSKLYCETILQKFRYQRYFEISTNTVSYCVLSSFISELSCNAFVFENILSTRTSIN
jgi:hypothetical protein